MVVEEKVAARSVGGANSPQAELVEAAEGGGEARAVEGKGTEV